MILQNIQAAIKLFLNNSEMMVKLKTIQLYLSIQYHAQKFRGCSSFLKNGTVPNLYPYQIKDGLFNVGS